MPHLRDRQSGRLRVSHDFVNGDLEALRIIVELNQHYPTADIGEAIPRVKPECLQS